MNTRAGSFFGIGLDVETKRTNLQLQMKLQKRNDGLSLRNLLACLQAQDTDRSGALDFEAFEMGLKKYNVFMPVAEIQALMKAYNAGPNDRHRLMRYADWVRDLRVPLEGRRLDIVNNAFNRMAGSADAACFTVAQARECFGFEGFDQWCNAIEVDCANDEATVSRADFLLFYADISMGCFEDSKFIKLVEDTWQVSEPIQAKVDVRNVETLINTVRNNLIKFGNDKHHEEFVLRDLFRQFDRNSDGELTLEEVRGMLQMLNVTADEAHLIAFVERVDVNKSGTIDFEEFVSFMVQDRYTRTKTIS